MCCGSRHVFGHNFEWCVGTLGPNSINKIPAKISQISRSVNQINCCRSLLTVSRTLFIWSVYLAFFSLNLTATRFQLFTSKLPCGYFKVRKCMIIIRVGTLSSLRLL